MLPNLEESSSEPLGVKYFLQQAHCPTSLRKTPTQFWQFSFSAAAHPHLLGQMCTGRGSAFLAQGKQCIYLNTQNCSNEHKKNLKTTCQKWHDVFVLRAQMLTAVSAQ